MTHALTRLQQSSSPALRVVIAALLIALTAGGVVAVRSQKTVTLDVDGTTMTVTTMKSRVVDIVEENGLSVGDRDEVFAAGADCRSPSTDSSPGRCGRPRPPCTTPWPNWR